MRVALSPGKVTNGGAWINSPQGSTPEVRVLTEALHRRRRGRKRKMAAVSVQLVLQLAELVIKALVVAYKFLVGS